jgi:hypothetical protein
MYKINDHWSWRNNSEIYQAWLCVQITNPFFIIRYFKIKHKSLGSYIWVYSWGRCCRKQFMFMFVYVHVHHLWTKWQQKFPAVSVLSEVGETVVDIQPQIVGISACQEFYKNDRFLTAAHVTYILKKFSYFWPKITYKERVSQKEHRWTWRLKSLRDRYFSQIYHSWFREIEL